MCIYSHRFCLKLFLSYFFSLPLYNVALHIAESNVLTVCGNIDAATANSPHPSVLCIRFNVRSDEQGKNPLYHAIKKDGRADVIRTLISSGCDVNNRDLREKRMPLAVRLRFG